MSEQIESVTIEGQAVHVTARPALGVEPRALAIAAAIRVFGRYAVLDRITLTVGSSEIGVSRDEITRLIGPEGFAPLQEPARYRQVVHDALRAHSSEEGGG